MQSQLKAEWQQRLQTEWEGYKRRLALYENPREKTKKKKKVAADDDDDVAAAGPVLDPIDDIPGIDDVCDDFSDDGDDNPDGMAGLCDDDAQAFCDDPWHYWV